MKTINAKSICRLYACIICVCLICVITVSCKEVVNKISDGFDGPESIYMEFREAYTMDEVFSDLVEIDNALKPDTLNTEKNPLFASDEELNTDKGPLFRLLKTGYTGSSVIGFAQEKDTAEVSRIINEGFNEMGYDGVFSIAWGNHPVPDMQNDDSPVYELYVLHAKNKDNITISNGDIMEARCDDSQSYISINLTMTEEGGRKFESMTRNNINNYIAILGNGRVYSAPRVMSVVSGGKVEITGNFSMDEARHIAKVLTAHND